MEGSDETPTVDGRTARRQRNINAALEVVREMLLEDAVFPTMEQVATRSGLSLRSLYRYFADPMELIEATVARITEQGREIGDIKNMGEGPFEDRVDAFVASRLRLHEAFGQAQQAALFHAFEREPARERVNMNRAMMRQQMEIQFAPELSRLEAAQRERVVAAADLLTQMESLWYLRRHRELTPEEIAAVLADGLRRLLT